GQHLYGTFLSGGHSIWHRDPDFRGDRSPLEAKSGELGPASGDARPASRVRAIGVLWSIQDRCWSRLSLRLGRASHCALHHSCVVARRARRAFPDIRPGCQLPTPRSDMASVLLASRSTCLPRDRTGNAEYLATGLAATDGAVSRDHRGGLDCHSVLRSESRTLGGCRNGWASG